MYRVEDKYELTENDFFLLANRMDLLLKTDNNNAEGKSYKISSVYFDDIYDTHYIEAANGNPERSQYRIRIYNDSFETIKLEIKSKKYNRVKKTTVGIACDQMKKLLQGDVIDGPDDLDDPRMAFNTAIRTMGLRPRVIVTYERRAYVYEAGNVRITFDSNIRASSQTARFGDAAISYEYPRDIDYVLEVKYDEFLPDFIAQSLEINGMWQVSKSKYGICREIYL